ncbi:MAG: sugar transferase [Pseudobutyrivibrio sp.]|nr:sugar transferase [Pseudobutyrivibrio sp.]
MFIYVWTDYVYFNNHTGYLLGIGNVGLATIIYVTLLLIFGKFFRAFGIGVERKTKQIVGMALSLCFTDFIEILVSSTIQNNFRYVIDFAWRYALLAIAQSILLGLIMIMMNVLYKRWVHPLPIALIYGDYENDLADKIDGLSYKYKIEKSYKYDDPSIDLNDIVVNSSNVLINDVPAHVENKILKLCFDHDIRVYVVPKIADIILKSSDSINVIDTPLYLNRNLGMSFGQRFLKRTFDILFCGLAVILLSPIFLITALAIKLEDHGPVFFRQERVTKGGKHFMILKFRSMIVNAEKDGKPHPAGEKDDRITKVGRIIRAVRIDELPQLFNILRGDMSIVGPRPERYEHVMKYTQDIPEFRYREKVKGGLTGYAQVYGKYNTTALDKLKLDLTYIANYSIMLDFQIIFETFKILFQKESTEGFDSKRAREMHDADCK